MCIRGLIFAALLLLPVLALRAQSVVAPLPWRVETTRPQSVDHTLYRGETVSLQPRFESATVPLELPAGALVRLLYRSPDMAGGAYHELPGALHAEDTGRVTVLWTPAADSGADLYDYNLIVQTADQTQTLARAYGKLHLRGSVFGEASDPAIIEAEIYTRAQIDALLETAVETAVQYDPATTLLTTPLTLPPGAFWPEYLIPREAEAINVLGVNSEESSTVEDALVVTRNVSYRKNARMGWSYIRNPLEREVVWSVQGDHASLSEGNLLTWVSDGTVTATATLGGFSASVDVVMTSGNDFDQNVITGGVADSFRKAVTDPVDTMIAGDAGAVDRDLFSTADKATLTFVRNLDSFAYDLAPAAAWSGVAVASSHARFIRGSLISEDVIAFSWHNKPAIGESIHWLGTDGQIYTRTVTAVRQVAGVTDSGIGLLSSALPAEVVPLKLLPAEYQDYIGQAYQIPGDGFIAWQLPAVTVNQFNEASVRDTQAQMDLMSGYFQWAYFSPSPTAARVPYWQEMITGDSGQPAMLTDGTHLILLSTWLSPSSGPAHVLTPAYAEAVTLLGGTQPTAIDLSGYTDYRAAQLPTP